MVGSDLSLVVALLAASGTVTTAHLAALGIRGSRLRTLQEEGFRRADTLARVQENAGAVSLTAHLLADALALAAVGVGFLYRTFTLGDGPGWLDLVIGGALVIVVRNLTAARHPVRLGLIAAPALMMLGRLGAPLDRLASKAVPAPGNNGGEKSGERELNEIRELGREEGVIEEAESRLVERAFRLDELSARDVMVPRVDIFAWPESLTTREVHEELAEVPYSRVPVYGESIDDVTGVVHVRDIYRRLAAGDSTDRLGKLARRPLFVAPSRSCSELVADFRSHRVHLGIVADEFGGTDGLVTLEDVIEELVGEIQDETDLEAAEPIRTGSDELLCGGGTDLREIAEALGVTFPRSEHRSLNGLILEGRGGIPERGEQLDLGEVRVEITGRTDSRVTRARVIRLGAPSGEA